VTSEVALDGVFRPDDNAFPDVRRPKGAFTSLDQHELWRLLGAEDFPICRFRESARDDRRSKRP
jgi:glutaryl-CoA dehydrogenase